jgi:AcrR family transcriptional regulator
MRRKVTPGTQPTRAEKKPRRLNRAQKREANRERIMRAARKVFGARGFHAATIEEIADEAGLSNGAIYYNFESKGDLFFALLEERQEDRIRHLRRTLMPRASSLEEVLENEARDATRSLKESREWRLLLFEFIAHAARTPALAPRLREHKRRFRAALADVLAERLHERASTEAIDELALAATALADGLALAEITDPGSVPDELLGDLLALLLSQSGAVAGHLVRGGRPSDAS